MFLYFIPLYKDGSGEYENYYCKLISYYIMQCSTSHALNQGAMLIENILLFLCPFLRDDNGIYLSYLKTSKFRRKA